MKSNYEKVKEWRVLNKEKVNEQARRYRKKHPDTNIMAKRKYRMENLEKIREKDRVSQAIRRKNNPEAQKKKYLKWRMKKEEELTKIAGRPRSLKCEICNSDRYKIVFDHCHKKGNFRGWICDQCNKVLGLVKDSKEILEQMISYLERNDESCN